MVDQLIGLVEPKGKTMYLQFRYLRFPIHLFRCTRMLWRGYRKGVPIHKLPEGSKHKHTLRELAVKFAISAWKVSGYKEEPFPSLFPSKEQFQ